MKTISDYSIYCTEDQTRKALELGAPILNYPLLMSPYGVPKFEEQGIAYILPTAEQMLNWLEEQGLELRVIKQRYRDGTFAYVFTMIDNDGYFKPHKINMVYTNRKEATLAAIDAALEYLTNS